MGATVLAQGTPAQLGTDPRSIIGPLLAGAPPCRVTVPRARAQLAELRAKADPT
jgi:hypothetical protein